MAEIQFMEMPDWCTWEDILACIHMAHSNHEKNGIVMTTLHYSAKQLKERIERNAVVSKIFVAVDNGIIIGTAGVAIENKTRWCYSGKVAHLHYDAVLPEYQGKHIFSGLAKIREDWVINQGCRIIEGVTAEKNKHRINLALNNGAKLIDFYVPANSNLYYVYFAKWLDGCPYSDFYIQTRFILKRFKSKLLYKPGKIKRFF